MHRTLTTVPGSVVKKGNTVPGLTVVGILVVKVGRVVVDAFYERKGSFVTGVVKGVLKGVLMGVVKDVVLGVVTGVVRDVVKRIVSGVISGHIRRIIIMGCRRNVMMKVEKYVLNV